MKGYFIPPANEVWGKVMFLHLSVSHSVQRGDLCMMSLPVWLPGPMFFLGVHVSGPMFLPGGGLCPGGSLCLGVFSVQRSLSGREFLSGRPPIR